MAHKQVIAALCMLAAASPAGATNPRVAPPPGPEATDSADALYCMRIEAITGSRLERTVCWTRAEWAENDVDVDKDWAENGVSIIRR